MTTDNTVCPANDVNTERARGHAVHLIARAVDVYQETFGGVMDWNDPDACADVRMIVDDIMDGVWDAYTGNVESSPG